MRQSGHLFAPRSELFAFSNQAATTSFAASGSPVRSARAHGSVVGAGRSPRSKLNSRSPYWTAFVAGVMHGREFAAAEHFAGDARAGAAGAGRGVAQPAGGLYRLVPGRA